MKTVAKTLSVLAVSIAAASAVPTAMAGDRGQEMNEKESHYFSNGWREGKIEAAVLFNEHLNPFDIDVEVNRDVAYLVGSVSSDIEKDLAEQVALSVEGISQVENKLTVNQDAAKAESRSERRIKDSEFVKSVKDATLAAQVKMKLLANSNVSGLKIDVDTKDQVVELKGEVPSNAAKELAGRIAENTEDVRDVRNKLKVVNS
ncbi:BON domain-containing protein [Simiduia sp. 21SJ11W-1]|uniref:BON domain-containing protein n=1 Tax=Simiduia sp. 21SJ11W-1 TaxID=2909669 RepID=UPI00209F3C0C|nr:BON domain-containing protein [Simiduia sp. 21SJ11W-1]UTA48516.1 BON domain-containing protein [Simiduia sp. 21SJ11W-1]